MSGGWHVDMGLGETGLPSCTLSPYLSILHILCISHHFRGTTTKKNASQSLPIIFQSTSPSLPISAHPNEDRGSPMRNPNSVHFSAFVTNGRLNSFPFFGMGACRRGVGNFNFDDPKRQRGSMRTDAST